MLERDNYTFMVMDKIQMDNWRNYIDLPRNVVRRVRTFFTKEANLIVPLPQLHEACAFAPPSIALPLIAAASREELWHSIIIDKDAALHMVDDYTPGRFARERLSLCADARQYRLRGGNYPYKNDVKYLEDAKAIAQAVRKRGIELGAPWEPSGKGNFDLFLLDEMPRNLRLPEPLLLEQDSVMT